MGNAQVQQVDLKQKEMDVLVMALEQANKKELKRMIKQCKQNEARMKRYGREKEMRWIKEIIGLLSAEYQSKQQRMCEE